MARPKKQTVDYFPHIASAGRSIFILENRWGNDGYAFWFKLLEILCLTDGHVYDCGNPSNWEFLTAKTRVNDQTATEILNKLAEIGNIDADLWKNRVIWCQSLVDNVKDAYKKRTDQLPKKPVSATVNPPETSKPEPETPQNNESGSGSTESKVKYSKVNNNTIPENPETHNSEKPESENQNKKPDPRLKKYAPEHIKAGQLAYSHISRKLGIKLAKDDFFVILETLSRLEWSFDRYKALWDFAYNDPFWKDKVSPGSIFRNLPNLESKYKQEVAW